jgi:hypothetical protein
MFPMNQKFIPSPLNPNICNAISWNSISMGTSAEGLSALHTQNLAFICKISQHKDDRLICHGGMNFMY